ncbi:uncharacterized protein CELE_B0302.4 [Caenorhabditis elegans]|uniref:Uncharacterized protein B0302.4 n=1 Tax=Caenorhabditis elegans TaxID=6239 RepID=YWR4_CAEEL|nr:Uncharacterized protein CELE_B0302.4 [Caenorhabditis elegans]Q10927.2 RecName: Full=Uncharacterized protein B0302.4 [Caenorhabditis elegans]CCD61699.1 Uncharacterized protein CELE_B0302.4 [Caenorhabditis elegans]|eukprot:NP_510781.2 Uncharacterized protein CELE_B0302.4 [Caenorhabditis elegans]
MNHGSFFKATRPGLDHWFYWSKKNRWQTILL